MSQPEATSALPLVYGVWLTGKGWLRGANSIPFADLHREYAEAALGMSCTKGKVVLIDEDMITLEGYFLMQESKQKQRGLLNRLRSLIGRIVRFLDG